MPVISVSVPLGRYGVLAHESTMRGVVCDLVETDEEGGRVYADLSADPYRSLTVAMRVGATPHAVVDEVEHGEVIKSRPVRV